MTRLIQATRSGVDESEIEELLATSVYSPAPDHWSLEQVRSAGVTILPADQWEPSESEILLLPAPAGEVDHLVAIVDRLLGPGGCPWDQAQTHESLKRHLVEETYEVIDAIDAGNVNQLCEELGDLLLQPVLHGQISRAAGGFDTEEVALGIVEKLIRRHPHVFGDLVVSDADEVLKNWDRIKQREKSEAPRSILAGVPRAMPALQRALEVSKRAARTGFEWPDLNGVFEKLEEEILEIREALAEGSREQLKAEIGDLLFTVVNIARWSDIEPEGALREMVDRFSDRFRHIEANAACELIELSPEEWERLWSQAKASTNLE